MTKLATLVCLIALCALSFAHAQQAGERTTLSGVFTAEQAKNGERIFQSRCAACHGSDLHATDPEVPDLTDDGFKYGWLGKTVANRFRNIRTAMPAGAPGSLDDQTYIDIVAYILQFNGMPASNQKLVPELDSLEKIVITAR